MRIAVTGAAGNLGRLIIDNLIARDVDPANIVAIIRNEAKASEFSTRGIQVAIAPYEDVDALTAALANVDRLVLVSGSEVGRRLGQHANIIEAAKTAGVEFIAYTSLLNATSSPLSLAPEHLATEKLLADSRIPHALLRNGWYWENYASALDTARTTGHTFGAARDGKVSGAARKDYAEAAAIVATSDDQAGKVYELAGAPAQNYSEMAAAFGSILDTEVTYLNQSENEYADILITAGLPDEVAKMLAGWDSGIAEGTLFSSSTDLPDLLGHQTTSFIEVFAK